jgi:hypothetical protein
MWILEVSAAFSLFQKASTFTSRFHCHSKTSSASSFWWTKSSRIGHAENARQFVGKAPRSPKRSLPQLRIHTYTTRAFEENGLRVAPERKALLTPVELEVEELYCFELGGSVRKKRIQCQVHVRVRTAAIMLPDKSQTSKLTMGVEMMQHEWCHDYAARHTYLVATTTNGRIIKFVI